MSKKAGGGKASSSSATAVKGGTDETQNFWKTLKAGHCHQLSDLLFVASTTTEGEAEQHRRPNAVDLVNSRNDKGLSPLTFSIAAGHEVEVCEILIRAGAKVNDCDNSKDRNTPLLAAAVVEDDIIIQSLVKHNADLTKHDALGRNVLHIAARNGSRNLFTFFLCEAGASESTSLANLMKQDVDGTAPLHYALGEVAGCVPIALEALDFLEKASDVTAASRALALTTKSLATPLHVLASSGVSNPAVAQIASIAVKLGSNVWAQDDEGNSPLHIAACTHSSAEVLLKLLESASAEDLTSVYGCNGEMNLIHCAAANGRKAVLQAMLSKFGKGTVRLDACTKPPGGEQGHQAVEVAILAGHDALADLLVQHGAPDLREQAKARRDELEAGTEPLDAPEDAGGDYSGHGTTTIGASRVQAARKSRSTAAKKRSGTVPGGPSEEGGDGTAEETADAAEAASIERGMKNALEKRQKAAEERAAAENGPNFWMKALVIAIFLSTLIPMLDLMFSGSSSRR